MSQIRRSSRSVCLNLREAWAKRRYEAHFISKLTDCDGENSETDSSLDFALECGYITETEHIEMSKFCEEIGKMLGRMIKEPGNFLISDVWRKNENHDCCRYPAGNYPPFPRYGSP